MAKKHLEIKSKKESKIHKNKFEHENKYKIQITGKTPNQKLFLKMMYDKQLIIANGVAGSGKSFISTGFACKQLIDNNFKSIIISRPNIALSKSLGFFPGTLEEKIYPWISQILTYMEEFVNKNVVQCWIKNKQLQMIPIEVLRGKNFSDSIVIIDEAQNLTIHELKCIVTRITETSKLIICGDSQQSDLKERDFEKLCRLIMNYEIQDASVIHFTIDDCLRSGLCADLLRLFEKEGL